MLGFNVKALDDCGAFPRYEPLGCIIWAQVTPGCYAWRNIRVDFTQVTTNKSPVSPNRGYSRMQHLWLTERICDIVGTELGIDPVEMRKRNYVKTEQMPYETPNGCVYDSGDYARCLDIALELIGYDSIEARREEAAARGKLLGIGIGSTLDSGTNNFGQSTLLNPELQFSGNNEAATVKLDIFGELVVTLGTVPQGQGHETTASQVVADILGCSPDQVHVRPGHDTFFNSHAGFSGTYASQFAVTGLGAVKGAAEALRAEMIALAAAVLQAPEEAIELADGFARIKDGPPEAALPFMALGAIVNANNAFLPPDFNPTLNHRFVYRPYFGMVDTEKKTGKLTLTYATQIHACVVEVDRETGVVEIVDYAAVDDCGTRIHPQIVEGQVHGATVHAIGAALYEDFVYDEDGQLLTSNFYDYHVPHALDVPPLKTGAIESPSPFSPLGSKGMGEGGGGGIHCICSAIQDALKPAGAPIVYDSCNPYHRVWSMLQDPESTRANVTVCPGMKVEGRRSSPRPREVVWQVLNDPAQMAKLMPGVEGFEIKDDRHWQAKVKIPLGLGGLRMTIDFEKVEEREPEFAQLNAKGNGVGAIMNMQTQFNLAENGTGTTMRWEADVKIAGPVGAMGQRVLQPIINQQVGNVLGALEKQVGEAAASTGGAEQGIHPASPEAYEADPERADAQHRRQELGRRGGTVPHRRHAADDGAARRDARVGARDGRGRDGHGLARRGVPVVAQAPDGGARLDRRLGADGARDRAADDRLGDHLAVHAPSGAGGDGRAGRAGGGGAGAVHPRLRDVEDLPQQRADADEEDARADARRRRDRPRRARRRGVLVRGRHVVGRRARALGRGAHAARGAAGLRRRDGAEDAGARRRDRRGLPDPVDHDARLRPLHGREHGLGHRHRLHGRRLDRRGSRGRAATARARSPACTSRTRCRTSRAPPTRCSTWPS